MRISWKVGSLISPDILTNIGPRRSRLRQEIRVCRGVFILVHFACSEGSSKRFGASEMTEKQVDGDRPVSTLELRDSRTGQSYTTPIVTEGPEGDTYVRAMDLRKVKVDAGEFGLLTYDPAFM